MQKAKPVTVGVGVGKKQGGGVKKTGSFAPHVGEHGLCP